MEGSTIVLGGRTWNILPLPIGKVKFVQPALQRLTDAFKKGSMSEQDYESVINLLFISLQHGTPSLTKDELENMHINWFDIVEALPIIQEAAGLVKEEKSSNSGERKAD